MSYATLKARRRHSAGAALYSIIVRPQAAGRSDTMAPLDVGLPAPDFTLSSTTGDKITLSQVLKEKNAVLVFYVLAFSSV